jgi:hypothetical protein
MGKLISQVSRGGCVSAAACAVLFSTLIGPARPRLEAQAKPASSGSSAIPDLAGIWDGRSHPTNSPQIPWFKAGERAGKPLPDGTIGTADTPPTFPELNERALAYMKVMDEWNQPKYYCQPSTPPALEYDHYMQEIVQLPDRVLFKYEKDDQVRTVWLDGRKPTIHDVGYQGYSVGRYEGNALIVEADHYVFDIVGFDDQNSIPSSALKKVTERYWREGNQLKATITVEDPLFLRKPASFTMRMLPAPKGYQMQPFECDMESAAASLQFVPQRYK